ncbi:hypothetical protein [Jiangella endophytica]|uniref:hypothetical protein n=1 Tax=Jiangella endophytica TaxID=1623398 RepID=UPI001300459F|nr:hypothetical protein [Jiangella endophytica]
MDLLVAVSGSVFALVGVLLGGLIAARSQRRSQEAQNAFLLRSERRDALVGLLASVRGYRRFLMYADVRFETVPPSDVSKGTVLVEGRQPYDAAMDEAVSRLLIVTGSATVIEEADRLRRRINEFMVIRAEYGRGAIPNEVIREFRDAEHRFAELARAELERPA